MQKGKARLPVGSSATTLVLEEETRQMEKKLLLMKDFIKNIGRYKSLNEREVQDLIRKTVQAKPTESKQKTVAPAPVKDARRVGALSGVSSGAKVSVADGDQSTGAKPVPSQEAYRPSNLLRDTAPTGTKDFASAFESKIDEIASKDRQKMAQFYAEARIPGLQEVFEKNGVWSVADLGKVGEEFCNGLYLTAAKQDRIAAAVRMVSQNQPEEKHEIIIQTDDLLGEDLTEFEANFPGKDLEGESEGSEKPPTSRPPTTQGLSDQNRPSKAKELVFSTSLFDFGAIFGEALAPLTTKTEPKSIPKRPMPPDLSLVACQECFASFLVQKDSDQVAELPRFCSELCERKAQTKKASRVPPVEAVPVEAAPLPAEKLSDALSNFSEEPLTEERLAQEVARRLQADPEDPIDLDFDFDFA